MPKKIYTDETEFTSIPPEKTEKVIEVQRSEQEEDYFFPDKRVTIKASSLGEALKKLKELK